MHSVSSLWLLVIACSLTGCHVFDDAPDDAAGPEKSKLPPITAAPNAIELEIGHIRRPIDDPIISERLWNDINQVVAGDEEMSWQRIRDNGFRVGIAAAQPPDSLVTLLQPPASRSGASWTPIPTKLQSVVVRDGTPTEVTASPYFTRCKVAVAEGAETTYREFELAQGKYQITARKTQDGWVELEIVPVMYHSHATPRFTAAAAGSYTLQHGQKRKIFHPNRFQVRMMVGEWVVIGGSRDQPGTLGHQFYFGTEADDQQLQEYRRRTQQKAADPSGENVSLAADEDLATEGDFQRLLVVRIANMKPAVMH
ncbi:hypothetical protein CA54_34080 [Symmachiella macrocystis]|uniref:Uncharacterized protein n=1 Tax=Symmachiella macrocystis TaxID=2527985 RepID=A0A5C6BV31_9PLAN|nr:hypothetical protein CA54_34080 [Symmachiella macrocystis]